MIRTITIRCLLLVALAGAWSQAAGQQKSIYKKGWIDFNKNGVKDLYEDQTQPIDRRIEDLLSRMTLEEKSCQMATLYGYGRVLKDEQPTAAWKNEVWKDGIANIDEALNSVPGNKKAQTQYSFPFSKHVNAKNNVQRWFVEETRLGIPVDFTNEGIHGLCHEKATPLPAPIAIGSTWNPALVRRAGQIVGREGKALGYTNIYAPILDPARDQRWGRVVECYGEDPFLIAEMGKQMVLGIQEQGIASTLKHFAVYSIPKGGRDGNARTDPHVAPRELHQLHLYPFARVIREAAPLGVMSSYNDWDGVPVTGSAWFLTELLRKQYGFKGYVVSDSRAVEFLHEKHKVASDFKESTRQSVNAGLNVWTNFYSPEAFIKNIRALVSEGKLSEAILNDRVRDVLRVKFLVGLFDQPYADPAAADKMVHTAEGDSLELQLNREALVLLKNEGNLLPLHKASVKKILVTGPLADATGYMVSRYGPGNNPTTSILKGIQKKAGPSIIVRYEKGCTVTNPGWPESEIIPTPLSKGEKDSIAMAVAAAADADVIIAVLGGDEKTVGESLSRTSLDLPGRQQQLLEALYATGKPVVLVLVNGQPLTINWADQYIPAILETWFTGPSGGIAVAEALFGEYNPGGRLTITFPKTLGQLELNFPYKPGSQATQSLTPDPNGYGKTMVNGPLYTFGHGLSYTTFTYADLRISPEKGGTQSRYKVSVDVTNSGSREGDEVVQLYMKDLLSSVTTYEMQLRGFQRIRLKPGEQKRVEFELTPGHLQLLDEHMHWRVEPGRFEIGIGAGSADIRLKKTFDVE